MGKPSGCSEPGREADYQRVRNVRHGGPSVAGQVGVARRKNGTFEQKIPDPSVGDRFGELTVVGSTDTLDTRRMVSVQCSCGAEPHAVYIYNLRKGASTRCNTCAKKASGYCRKDYFKYADACPDDDHRRRLLNRLSACKNRCHNPKDAGYANYGARGIVVYEPWRSDKAAFLRYVLTLEGWDEPRLELDRIDVDKGYEPGNLRFITHRANSRNKRSVQDLQARCDALEARLRHCTCGA